MFQRLKECGTENSPASSATNECQLPCRSHEEEERWQKQNKGLQNLLTLQNQEQKNLSPDQIRNNQEALNAPGKDDNFPLILQFIFLAGKADNLRIIY